MALPKGQGVIPLPPFKAWLASNIPAVYDNTLTYYEELVDLIKYLQDTVVPAVNHNAEALTIVSNALEQLKQYVDDYFANLDVQEEINNKLDQMVKAGTLQEIITAYIQANVAWSFDTVADMKVAENFINGSYAQTLGYHAKNDGGASLYKIRTITNDDVIDEGSIIALADNTLVAELIVTNGVVTPEQFGAYGDGVHDDVLAIRKALNYVISLDTNITTWGMSGELQLLSKTYLISDSIIDSTFPTRVTNVVIKGSGTRTNIMCGDDCSIVLNNLNKIGFSNFIDLGFVGKDNTFLFENGSQPQRLRFIRCHFKNFHTMCNIEGTVDNSEFVFDQCAVQNCGTVSSPCELFIMNNAQAVNWRFYATDIESFIGKCFHFLKGTSMSFFQGSIIPSQDGTVFDYTDADPNAFGDGNYPTITLYGVRYELRNSKLLNCGSYTGRVVINHIGCGMGGQNIADGSDTIVNTSSILKLSFDSCYNFENYKFNINFNRSLAKGETNDGYIKFYNCDYETIMDIIGRSTLTATSESYYDMFPSIVFNNQPITGISKGNIAKFSGQIVNSSKTMLTHYGASSDGDGNDYNFPRAGFVTEVVMQSVYATAYGGSAKLKVEVYNANNTKIGEGEYVIQSRSKVVIPVNAEVTTGWYVRLSHTYGTGQTLYIPHIIYAEYLS